MPQSLSILLLEDDDADAYLTGRALLALPRVAEVKRLRNGQDAVRELSAGRLTPDLVLVDLQMPTMDGLQFLAACMDQGLANVPMVVLTSSSDRKDVMRSRVQGALRVITKPDNPGELKQLLQEAIDAFTPDQSIREHAPAWRVTQAAPTSAPTSIPAKPTSAPQFGRRQPRQSA